MAGQLSWDDARGMETLSSKLPFTAASTALRLYSTSRVFWDRRTSDDLLYLLLILVNEYVQEVPLVSGIIRAPGPSSLYCMLTKCGGEIIACQSDASCKSALDCLDGCPLNDQVCQYRCIVSYESQQLEAFSLCILQKHNCLNNNAQIPALPDPAPLPSFQGQPLTHELAERIFIGGLEASPGGCDTSWKVVAGRNPAYDYFPCQNQLFYPAKTGRSMWYDPVFKVKTLDDRQVWRRRHYRVRRGKAPGTFHFSVLDNGVMSTEFWRILACADDYSWGVFFYSGAASRAGLAYEGALVVTQDGNWPADEHVLEQIRNILDGAGIKMWEMHSVDNSACSGSPLGLPDFAPPLLEAAVQRAAA